MTTGKVYRQTVQTVDGKGIKGKRFNNHPVKDGLSNSLILLINNSWVFHLKKKKCNHNAGFGNVTSFYNRIQNCVYKSGDWPTLFFFIKRTTVVYNCGKRNKPPEIIIHRSTRWRYRPWKQNGIQNCIYEEYPRISVIDSAFNWGEMSIRISPEMDWVGAEGISKCINTKGTKKHVPSPYGGKS